MHFELSGLVVLMSHVYTTLCALAVHAMSISQLYSWKTWTSLVTCTIFHACVLFLCYQLCAIQQEKTPCFWHVSHSNWSGVNIIVNC